MHYLYVISETYLLWHVAMYVQATWLLNNGVSFDEE